MYPMKKHQNLKGCAGVVLRLRMQTANVYGANVNAVRISISRTLLSPILLPIVLSSTIY